MSAFSVDPTALTNAAANLDALRDGLPVSGFLASCPAEQLGAAALDEVLLTFHEACALALTHTVAKMRELAEDLRSAAVQYQSADDAVRDAATPAGPSCPSDSSPEQLAPTP